MKRLALCLLVAVTVSAAAGSMTIVLRDGKKKRTVTPLRFDEIGLTARSGSDEVVFPWEKLTPESAFAARNSLTSFESGTARLGLAEFALRLGLFEHGQAEFEVAQALGALTEAEFEKKLAALRTSELGYYKRRIDGLLKKNVEPRRCLELIKKLKERYPDDAVVKAYEPAVEKLVDKIADKADAKVEADQKRIEDKATARLRKAVMKLVAKKTKAMAKADALMAEAPAAIKLRQVSRVKKKLVEPAGAERYLKRARKYLRQIAKVDKKFEIVKKAAIQAEYEAIEKKMLACYLDTARILMKERNYKGASEYVRKILYYDPIHEEALEMVKQIRKNRIRFKMSDITNARPRVSGG